MSNKIQFKRGNKTNLPLLNQGEPAFCIDTEELFIGVGKKNLKLLGENKIINNLTSGGNDNILSAEQGKILNTKINELKNRFDNMQVETLYLSEYPNHSDYSQLINDHCQGMKDKVIVCETNKEYRFYKPLTFNGCVTIIGNNATWRYMGGSDTFIRFKEGPWQIEGGEIRDLVIWCNEKSVGPYQKKYCFKIEGYHITKKFHNLKIYNFGYVWYIKDTDINSTGVAHHTFGHTISECNVWGFINVVNSRGNSEQMLIDHCWFDDGLRQGNSQNAVIRVEDATSFWIRNTTIQNADIGILFKGVRCGIIDGNHFENMLDSSVFFNADGTYDNRNNIVSGNWLVGAKGCIRFYRSSSSANTTNHTTIFGNTFGYLGSEARGCITASSQSALNNTQLFNNSKIDDSRLLYTSEVVTLKSFQ